MTSTVGHIGTLPTDKMIIYKIGLIQMQIYTFVLYIASPITTPNSHIGTLVPSFLLVTAELHPDRFGCSLYRQHNTEHCTANPALLGSSGRYGRNHKSNWIHYWNADWFEQRHQHHCVQRAIKVSYSGSIYIYVL